MEIVKLSSSTFVSRAFVGRVLCDTKAKIKERPPQYPTTEPRACEIILEYAEEESGAAFGCIVIVRIKKTTSMRLIAHILAHEFTHLLANPIYQLRALWSTWPYVARPHENYAELIANRVDNSYSSRSVKRYKLVPIPYTVRPEAEDLLERPFFTVEEGE